jgi:hypothetical protein
MAISLGHLWSPGFSPLRMLPSGGDHHVHADITILETWPTKTDTDLVLFPLVSSDSVYVSAKINSKQHLHCWMMIHHLNTCYIHTGALTEEVNKNTAGQNLQTEN